MSHPDTVRDLWLGQDPDAVLKHIVERVRVCHLSLFIQRFGRRMMKLFCD